MKAMKFLAGLFLTIIIVGLLTFFALSVANAGLYFKNEYMALLKNKYGWHALILIGSPIFCFLLGIIAHSLSDWFEKTKIPNNE